MTNLGAEMTWIRKYYFVVVQLTIEIYSLPVSTANGIKFRFQFN